MLRSCRSTVSSSGHMVSRRSRTPSSRWWRPRMPVRQRGDWASYWQISVQGSAHAGPRKRTLVRQAARGREGIEPILAQHVRGELERAENIGKGRVTHIQTAGKSAEGGQDHPRLVGGEAAAANGAPAMRNARDRVQMPGDLAGSAFRLMAEGQTAHGEAAMESATNVGRRIGIVIAGDPDPVASALHRVE